MSAALYLKLGSPTDTLHGLFTLFPQFIHYVVHDIRVSSHTIRTRLLSLMHLSRTNLNICHLWHISLITVHCMSLALDDSPDMSCSDPQIT